MSSDSAKSTFLPVGDKPNFPKNEEEVLKRWEDLKAYEQCLKDSKGKEPFIFYDGPPFATGLPHYGHLLASTIKDVVCRYAHQTGHHVERRWGWDTHGLPVEYEVDKMLNIKGKADVEAMGIDNYNETCRSIVLKYSGEWEKTIHRLGRWIDFENKYMTMSLEFMESEWWVFKQMFDKGHVYRAFRVMPYSTKVGTTLSNFELSQNYFDRSDPSIVIKFKVVDRPLWIVVWTTTPWTLPANQGCTVGPTLKYFKVHVKKNDETWIVGKDRFQWVCSKTGMKCESKKVKGVDGEETIDYKKDAKDYTILEEVEGESLVGIQYEPLFPYFKEFVNKEKAYRIISDSYVATDAGTCIVHCAPCHGEDDFRICVEQGIINKNGEYMINCIDADGNFTSDVTDFSGVHLKDAEKDICKHLIKNNNMLDNGVEVHSYPHCWRTDTPLIRKAVPSWFIGVEDIRDKLVENNKKTNWVPSHVKEKRFHNWLTEARDWCVSRSRYWGTPIPIWVSDDFEEIVCLGSIAELEQYAGRKITDLHKHFIDDIQIPSKKGKGMLKRVEDVFDCWFESGSMPICQLHYPFENKEVFEKNFPAKFISEGIDQTRGWFYTLMVVSTLLFDKAPWKNLIVNGLVLAGDGKKMSKRLKNYPDPVELINTHGADALRLYMCNSPVVRAEPIKFREDGVKNIVREVFLPWYNAYRFFVLESVRYEQLQNTLFKPSEKLIHESKNDMDRWILAYNHELIAFTRAEIGSYRLYTTVPKVVGFLGDLTNWYVRLNRDRMRGNFGDVEALTALSTLHSVLLNTCILLSPLTPFLTDLMYLNLRRALPQGDERYKESVHFVMLPAADETLRDENIVRAVKTMQKIVEMGRCCRERRKVGIKMPLKAMNAIVTTEVQKSDLERLRPYIEEELNVMDLQITVGGDTVKYEAVPNFKLIGPMVGKEMPKVKIAFGDLTQEQIIKFRDTQELEVLGFKFNDEHVVLQRQIASLEGQPNLEGNSEDDLAVVLDFAADDSLKEMYLSRELANRVQRLRKEANLQQDDPVDMYATDFSKNWGAVAQKKKEYVDKLLRRPLILKSPEAHETILAQDTYEVEKETVTVVITRKSAKFSPALDKLAGDAKIGDALKAYLTSQNYSDLANAQNVRIKVEGADKTFELEKGVHFEL